MKAHYDFKYYNAVGNIVSCACTFGHGWKYITLLPVLLSAYYFTYTYTK